MDFDTSISSSWSLKSNWDDPIFGSAVKRNELTSIATPISKDLINENSNQTTETPPTISDNSKKSTNEVSIGEKENLVSKFSISNLQPNIKGSLIETPKRINRTHENIQTPKEQRNERYPSPLPSNKSFSLNIASTPINSKNSITPKTPITPVTPKTPKNSYNFQSPGLFSTPRVISGRITSPCSHKTLEELQKILDPDIINMVKKSKEEIQDEEIDNKNDSVNENSNFHFEIYNTKNNEQDRDENAITEDLPVFGENNINLDENQEEFNSENFNQEESNQEELHQEESNQEESNQKEINFGQYFRNDSTPSKIFRNSRLQSILNQRKEDDQIYDQFQVKQIPLDFEQENTEDQQTIVSESNNSYNQSYEHENNDSLPFKQSQSQNSESEIKENEINDENKKKDPSQIFLSQISKFFSPISRSTPKRKLETDQKDNNSAEEQTQKQSSFTYTVLKKSENYQNTNIPIQQSDKTFVPEIPQKSFETHSNNDSLNLNDQQSTNESEIKENLLNDQNDQTKSFQYQVLQTEKKTVPEIPTFQPGPIIRDTKAKEEDQTESSDTESQQSPSDNSNYPIEKRIFMKYLSKRSNENSPRINVKGERNEADYLSKLMKEENKAAISPSKKAKTIQVLPNHQLSCTANKKSARYIVEEGELCMIIESKKFNVGKGGVFDIIKGKEIILINNGKEPAVIAKINRT